MVVIALVTFYSLAPCMPHQLNKWLPFLLVPIGIGLYTTPIATHFYLPQPGIPHSPLLILHQIPIVLPFPTFLKLLETQD
jgi:hypothetical protein